MSISVDGTEALAGFDAGFAAGFAGRIDVERLSGEIADDILTGEHAYAESRVPREGLVAIVTENLQSLLHSFDGGGLDLDPARRTGRIKAEYGIELAGVLHAYRLAGLRLWNELEVLSGSEASSRTVLFALGSRLWSSLDDLSTAAAEAHREVTGERDRWAARSKFAAVIDLLSPEIGAERRADAARTLMLEECGRFLVIVMTGSSSAVEILGARSHWAEHDGLTVCLLAASPKSETVITASGVRVGISREFSGLSEVIEAERQARIALCCLGTRREGISHYGDEPLDVILAGQPDEARLLVGRILAGVCTLPVADRDILLETFAAWVDSDGSPAATGEILHCHRNTVTYRLRRLESLTGRSPASPRDCSELTMALRAVRLFGWPEHASDRDNG